MAPGDEGFVAIQRDRPGESFEIGVGIGNARFLFELEWARLGGAKRAAGNQQCDQCFHETGSLGVVALVSCKPYASAGFRESRSPAGDGN